MSEALVGLRPTNIDSMVMNNFLGTYTITRVKAE